MLSFDLSAIDIVLLVAVFILFSLYLSKKPGTPKTETRAKRPQDDWQTETNHEPPSISKKQLKPSKTKPSATDEQPNAGFKDCIHEFGYLKDLPKNTPIPDECFGCPKVMQCLFPSE